MYIAIDIGNHHTKVGLFPNTPNDGTLQHVEVFDSLKLCNDNLKDNIANIATEAIIISSVRKEVEQVKQILVPLCPKIIILDNTTPIPLKEIRYNRNTLGNDRIAAAVGATLYGTDANYLIVDSGTCITYEFVEYGIYLGGNIAPGLEMRLEAMHHFTAKLPLVEAKEMNHYGSCTEEALQSGAYLGIIHEIEGYYRMLNTQGTKLILTGGDAALLSKQLTHLPHIVEPNLVLYGLNKILQYNI